MSSTKPGDLIILFTDPIDFQFTDPKRIAFTDPNAIEFTDPGTLAFTDPSQIAFTDPAGLGARITREDDRGQARGPAPDEGTIVRLPDARKVTAIKVVRRRDGSTVIYLAQ